MPTIDIIIRNKTASAVNPPCIVCGNSDYNVKFDFDEEWQAHNNKIGVFAYNRFGEWQSEKVLFEGDTCPVPALHGVRSVWIGVTAGDVRTSTPADVPCRMGATDFSDTTEKPSEDIWTQILDKLDSIGAGISTPDWAQNDPDGEGYIKNRCGGYDKNVKTVVAGMLVSKANTEIDLTNNAQIDVGKDVIVVINDGDEVVYKWTAEEPETVQISTGPNQYTEAVVTTYHIGTKGLDDTAWENGDWRLKHIHTVRADGMDYWTTRIKASYDAGPLYFVFRQNIIKPVQIPQKYTNTLRVCFVKEYNQDWTCDTAYADIMDAVNSGKLVYADAYDQSEYITRAYLWRHPSYGNMEATFMGEDRLYPASAAINFLYFEVTQYNRVTVTNSTLFTYRGNVQNANGIMRIYNGHMSPATPDSEYMTPSMGITKPAASEPQIEEGDLLSVARLSYGVPLKWQTRKIDATVTADSTNLVTSGAVYAAIQEAITNLTNVGE